ncbi:MAG: high frequency lysogenization protein HflD [bacterium]
MTVYTGKDRVIALAGVFQAARLTWRLARKGDADSELMKASVNSLFQLQPDSVDAVYGGLQGIESGLRCLLTQFEDADNRNVEITQYVIGILQLAKRLMGDEAGQRDLGEALEDLQSRRDAYGLEDQTLYAQLGKIYQDNISNKGPRIMIKGEPMYLENPDTAAKIRAMLLAGIRSAHLWYQCGGNRWKLMLQRKQVVDDAKQLLNRV